LLNVQKVKYLFTTVFVKKTTIVIWADTDVLFFINRQLMLIFSTTQTTVERQYFSALKRIAWNSAQT